MFNFGVQKVHILEFCTPQKSIMAMGLDNPDVHSKRSHITFDEYEFDCDFRLHYD